MIPLGNYSWKFALSFLWALPHVPFSFADFALYPFTEINCNCECNDVFILWVFLGNHHTWGWFLRTPNTLLFSLFWFLSVPSPLNFGYPRNLFSVSVVPRYFIHYFWAVSPTVLSKCTRFIWSFMLWSHYFGNLQAKRLQIIKVK